MLYLSLNAWRVHFTKLGRALLQLNGGELATVKVLLINLIKVNGYNLEEAV